MRSLRIKMRRGVGVYHCMSRSVAGAFLLDDEAKTKFQKILWEVAEFSGVEVLAYCLMTNHFHVLARVPERDLEVLTKEEVLRRYAVLYTYSNTPGYPDASVLRTIFAGENEAVVADWMARLTGRMNDVSEFMKTLKQRFTMWFNKRHQRFGPLWSDRFRSVLVQNDPFVLKTVAAYVDLNPVRAGLVADPARYAWSSYAEAVAGGERARKGIGRLWGSDDWSVACASYERVLRGKGARVADSGEGAAETSAETEATGDDVLAEASARLRQRQRPLSEGLIVGSRLFVEAVGREVTKGGEVTPPPDESADHASKSPQKPLGAVTLGPGGALFSWYRKGAEKG